MKRCFDVVVATLLLLLLSPVVAVTALVVKLRIGSPILFAQERPGLHGKPFRLYKFRTMTNATDDAGNPLPDHLRLTPLGQTLRAFSLDEFPQLINVIKGDLSLVGPRPLLMEYMSLYTEEQMKRHEVRPGMTGWAQVNGRNSITWEEKFALDLWYVRNRSLLLDLKILFLTVKKVIRTEGISHQNHVTMEKFTGT
ncbi:sugar transferase [Paenibacillus antri]|uniref:Sugar transferase n=1 Tax=Paenibacillus antri TaxID=2582848 RepID=A0A5R9G7K6_9BACL|nr:sugar transferase [Paenibacillus antri]TLS49418.1 sugar transferase [Paenibacillus antri]